MLSWQGCEAGSLLTGPGRQPLVPEEEEGQSKAEARECGTREVNNQIRRQPRVPYHTRRARPERRGGDQRNQGQGVRNSVKIEDVGEEKRHDTRIEVRHRFPLTRDEDNQERLPPEETLG